MTGVLYAYPTTAWGLLKNDPYKYTVNEEMVGHSKSY